MHVSLLVLHCRYFQAMVDSARRGSVTEKEFLEAARQCLDAERMVREHDADVASVLDYMGKMINRDKVRVVL